ncbi:MAG: rhodanese-like domain-containing protein [Chloroflexi bacterium]|nr:MAG: rhodanese-like domain-containing protein [Chloroflexota bacterium]
MKKALLILLSSSLVLAACAGAVSPPEADNIIGQPVPISGGGYTDINVTELETMLEDKDFLFVNVHIPEGGNIPNTDLFIPFDEISSNLELLPQDKNAKIVLYCRSDSMSGIAAEELVGLGYTNIWNLDGGYNAWIDSGLPFE